MPHAIKVHLERGKDGMVALLLESQGLDPSEYLGFMAKRFPKNKCMVLQGGGLQTEPASGGLPHSALIGADGTVLWTGNPNSAPKKIDTLIQEEIEKKIKPGWGKSPDLKKVRALMYGKGDLAGAAAALEAAEKSAKQDQQDDVAAAKKELEV
ncbi:MAG TPA: hypothetical protein VEI02_07965, partial [Planctomycetota bacterium]|nr:hypothetical protein [Planctomycetota bacterium]